MPGSAQRIFRTPPVSGTISPVSGLPAMNATNSARSDSANNGLALRRNSAVSTTVIGAFAMLFHYTQFAQGLACPQCAFTHRQPEMVRQCGSVNLRVPTALPIMSVDAWPFQHIYLDGAILTAGDRC